MYSFPHLEPVCCSMSSSNSCFLICIQISQGAGKVVWYSHLFKDFPQFDVTYTVKGFGIIKSQIANILWIIEKNKRIPEEHLHLEQNNGVKEISLSLVGLPLTSFYKLEVLLYFSGTQFLHCCKNWTR